jgi:hypothetical protein
MFQAAFECFPWDLDLEGYDESVGRLAGDIGVDAVRVAATHEGIHQLRPRAAEAARAFICGAAAHFQPDSKLYADSRIRPIPAAWTKSRNPLEKIAAAAQKNRLALRVFVSCCQGDAMAERYSHAACIDFFGRMSDNWLCPSNPDVRAYLGALVEDVTTNYPIAALELETADFGADQPLGWHARPLDSLSDPRQIVFSWCFCAACCQRAADAGADIAELRTGINQLLHKWDRPEPFSENILEKSAVPDANVAAFQRMRVDAVTSLIRLLRTRSKAPLQIGLLSPCEVSAAIPTELAPHCDGFYIPVVTTRDDQWPQDVVASAGGPARCDLGLPCHPPYTKDGPTLVTAVHRASQAGFRSITFQNYGCTPEPCLEWVRQAIRYARREAT